MIISPEITPFVKPLLIISAGIIMLGSSFLILSGSRSPEGVEIIDEVQSQEKDSTPHLEIVVEVAGAVKSPGVYRFSSGARVDEALEAAGGILDSANREFVSQTINKAAKIIDGQKIYIPFEGEAPVKGISTAGTQSLISINTAGSSALESLPGVGPATASKIIEGRPYGSLEELTSRKVVSAKVFGEIKELITLN